MLNEFGQSKEMEEQARNLKPGTWVRVAWLDREPTVLLFMGYGGPSRAGKYRRTYKGERSLVCYYPQFDGDSPSHHRVSGHAQHTQVIEILGSVQVPA